MVAKTEDLQSQFAHWIGRQTERQDIISDRLIEQFQATFGDPIFSSHLAGTQFVIEIERSRKLIKNENSSECENGNENVGT